MKANIELNKEELKRFVRKKTFTIKFPKLEQRTFYWIIFAFFLTSWIAGIVMYEIGEKQGSRDGFSRGYDSGEEACLRDNYEELTLKQSLAYIVKYNLPKIFTWIGLVVGIGWIIHGVGFKIL